MAQAVARLHGDLAAAVTTAAHVDLTLRLALLLFILHGSSASAVDAPLRIIAGVILALPGLLRQPILWCVLVAVLVVGIMRDWYIADNHKYLIVYIGMVCTISIGLPRPAWYLQTAARLVTALVFSLATLWKLLAGEYLDGSFLYWTFVTDGRFQSIGALIGGIDRDLMLAGDEAYRLMSLFGLESVTVPMVRSTSLGVTATTLSVAALMAEAVIGVLHLLPSERLYMVRHVALVAFVATTYFVFPVPGFAFALAVLGIAQCRERDMRLRFVYVGLFGLIQLTLVPWQRLLLG